MLLCYLCLTWKCHQLDREGASPIFEVVDCNLLTRQRRQWHPPPVLLPGKSHGWRSLVGCSAWAHEESDTTERLHFHFSLSCIREGNGNPLQCSCLENPRDRGAWWAAVCGVAQSRTQLKQISSSSSSSNKREQHEQIKLCPTADCCCWSQGHNWLHHLHPPKPPTLDFYGQLFSWSGVLPGGSLDVFNCPFKLSLSGDAPENPRVSARAAVTKHHRLGDLNNRNSFSHSSGGCKS